MRVSATLVAAAAVLAGALYLVTTRATRLAGETPTWPPEPFTVAVVWPSSQGMSFVHGATLAFDELSAAGGPLAGSMRLAVIEEDRDDDPIAIAREVASQDGVVAVLGHEISASAIPASLVYQQHGLLMLAPTTTAPRLTHHHFRNVFRLTPDDSVIAAAHAAFATSRGFKNVAVLFARTEGGEAAAGQFISHLRAAGIHVPFSRSYLPERRGGRLDFRPVIAEMLDHQIDAVVVADQVPGAVHLMVDLRRMGFAGPILGSDKLDNEQVWALSSGAAQELYVASAVDPSSSTPAYVEFRERFIRRWNEEPTYAASQGYEALRLLSEAFVVSQAVDALTVATTLRTRNWQGLFGEYGFESNGDVRGRLISIKRMDQGRFVTVERWKETAE